MLVWLVTRPLACVIVIVGTLIAAGCGPGEETGAAASPPIPSSPAASSLVVVAPESPQSKQIRVGVVEVDAVATDALVAPGRIMANPNRIARVLLPAPGRILDVKVGLGSTVEQGQPVVTLESPDADAAIAGYRQAEAAERQATAALTKAQTDLDRARDLYGMKAIAEKDVLSAQNDLAQAKGAAEVAHATAEQAGRKLDLLGLKPTDFGQRVLVRAPVNGKVLDVNVAPGEYRTDTSAALMTVADLTTVWVASEIPESSVRLIHVGDPVAISLLAYPGELFHGRVARIADALDPQTRTLKVYVELANPKGRFRPEMFGTVRHSGPPKHMPVVPPGAIVQEYGRDTVFLERAPGQYERRQVTAGPSESDRVPVLSGLQPGDRVVVDGAVLLKDR
jgi:membrane fusion protein, heavy metal efflux system